MCSAVANIYRKGGREKYREDSFYPTDAAATTALMIAEQAFMPGGAVYDGACGDGAILKVVAQWGRRVSGTDLIDRGYGRGGVDFLTLKKLPADILIMNPPYDAGLDEAFLRHAIALRPVYIAFLLKSQFFHAKRRLAISDLCAPARVYPLSWRIDFTGKRRPHATSSWFIFTPRTPTRAGYTRTMRALEHPTRKGE